MLNSEAGMNNKNDCKKVLVSDSMKSIQKNRYKEKENKKMVNLICNQVKIKIIECLTCYN